MSHLLLKCKRSAAVFVYFMDFAGFVVFTSNHLQNEREAYNSTTMELLKPVKYLFLQN